MKILIVSGFLGSGKTTFLGYLCKRLDNVVILENEIARDVDRELLSDEYSQLYSIDEGCVCCTTADQFEHTIISISAGLNPDYLVIEPTGIAKLSSMIKRIQKIEYERIQYIGSIAIVEINSYSALLDNYRETFLDTLQNSDIVLFSKSEQASQRDFCKAIESLSEFTNVQMMTKHYNDFTDTEWSAFKSLKHNKTLIESDSHLHVKTLSYTSVHFDNSDQMSSVLNAIMTGRFGNILRAKGGFTIDNSAYKLDIVRDIITVKQTARALSQCVFIGESLDANAFNTLFNHYCK